MRHVCMFSWIYEKSAVKEIAQECQSFFPPFYFVSWRGVILRSLAVVKSTCIWAIC